MGVVSNLDLERPYTEKFNHIIVVSADANFSERSPRSLK